jgi:hypothetical protein
VAASCTVLDDGLINNSSPESKNYPHKASSFELKQQLAELTFDLAQLWLFTCDAVSMHTNIH